MLDEMMEVIKIYKNLLAPFKDVSIAAQGSSYPTLPLVAKFLLPILNGKHGNTLQKLPEDGRLQEQVKDKMLSKYTNYFGTEE